MANEDETNKPQSFIDFRNANSLELVRLDNGTWEDVSDYVKVDNHNCRTRLTVCGRLHGRTRWNKALLVPNVRLEIVTSAPEQHEVWLDQIRARIAPWTHLQQEVVNIANNALPSGVKEIEHVFGGLVVGRVGTKPSSSPTNNIEEKGCGKLGTFPEKMEKLSIVDDLIAHVTAAVETGATLSKLVGSVERVTETAEFVADVSKCIVGVSTIFHLVALSAKGVSMYVEANRGRKALPVAFGRIAIFAGLCIGKHDANHETFDSCEFE